VGAIFEAVTAGVGLVVPTGAIDWTGSTDPGVTSAGVAASAVVDPDAGPADVDPAGALEPCVAPLEQAPANRTTSRT
jgi:hypothetical protein